MSYETITAPAGQDTVITVENETYENKLIDMTADNCAYRISMRGNATVRNVGWLGMPDYNTNGDFMLLVSGSGTATIENCFMDAMSEDWESETYYGGMYLGTAFSGHCIARNNYVRGFGNNGFYANMPAADKLGGAGGTIEFRDCYYRDNTPANIRPGEYGSTVENCLTVVNDPAGNRGRYYSNDSQLSRGYWHWDGTPMEIRNSCAYMDPNDIQPHAAYHCRNQHTSDSHVQLDVIDCYVNADAPSLYAEEGVDGTASVNFSNLTQQETATVLGNGGVPLTAEQAANGERYYPDPFDEGIDPGDGGGGSGPSEPTERDPLQMEDFSHGDVDGNYNGHTSHFGVGPNQ